MCLGLGSGSTAAHFVTLLAARVRDGLAVRCVATSSGTAALAEESGIRIENLDDVVSLDLTVDGTDEIDPAFNLIKGGGGALLREKIVASASKRMIVIADASKRVDTLGQFALPIEIVTFGHKATLDQIRSCLSDLGMDAELTLRRDADGGIFVTDNHNWIVDAAIGRIADPPILERALNMIPGVVENGLFIGIATEALIAASEGVTELTKP